MAGLSGMNPSGRFTGLAGLYAQHRPDYPEAALEFIVAHCGLDSGSLLVDVGCGTGISSRLFARRAVRVLGIEPNADMRSRAEAAPLAQGVPAPTYRDGRAEATDLPDATADVVLAAQAFHWFEPQQALREFRRILKSGGWTVLMWNERDASDPFTAAYGAVVRSTQEAGVVEGTRGTSGEVLLTSPLYTDTRRVQFRHTQSLDQEGLLGRAFSTSYAPRQQEAAEPFAAALRQVFARFQQQGRVNLQYNTSVFVARRGG